MPAKISVPRLTETCPRPRLFRALDAACRRNVVWISAPAGAGKTSLVTSWMAARRLRPLWYNVDARDGDAAHLFHYLGLAARHANPRRKLGLPNFTAENQQLAAFARGFFETLYEQLPPRSAIVLDDYHEARAELFDEVVREGIAALPRGVFFVIISRSDPPPSLLRHVASGGIAFIGVADLKLTPKDIAGFVRVYRSDLPDAKRKRALPRIVELANGWAAALMLLMQDRNLDTFDRVAVDQFSERLFDYFAAETFDKATPAQRDFFLKTSVVASLTTELASRLAGASEAGPMLAELDRRSFLVERLGASGAYRYHPLLRGFLLRRATAELGAGAVRELHRLAAATLMQAGQIEEAMEQFETADDVEERVRLLLQSAPTYVATGRSRTLAHWIARLPAERVEADGWLLYWQAISLLGDWEKSPRERLERAFVLFRHHGTADGLYLCCAAALQAIVQEAINFTHLDVWIERFETLERDGPPCPEPLLPVVATGMLMASAFRRSDAAHNQKWAERALQLSVRSPDLAHRVITGGFLSLYYGMYESVARALGMLEMLRAHAREAASSVVAMITVMQADALCAWLRGDNDQTVEHVRVAQSLSARSGVFIWNDFLYGLAVGAALSAEDFALADEFLEPMAEIAHRRPGWPAGVYHFHSGLNALARGDAVGAIHHAQLASASAEREGPPFGRIVNQLLLAQVMWQTQRAREAEQALALAQHRADEAACAVLRYGCLLVAADFAWNRDREHALACLRAGFGLGRERGFHNAFGLARGTLERAAVRALAHGIEPDHVRITVRKHGLRPADLPARLQAWPWRYRIKAFGPFVLTDHREPTEPRSFPGKNQRELRGMPLRLLQAVLVFGGRNVRDVRVTDALWPNAEGDAGRRVLDTTLHRLRRQMNDNDFVRLNDGRLYLDDRSCWLDLWAFDDLERQVENELARGAPAAVLTDLARQVLEVYRAPLLSDDGGASPWMSGPRDRYAARFRRIAHTLGEALERNGQCDEAMALAARGADGDRTWRPAQRTAL